MAEIHDISINSKKNSEEMTEIRNISITSKKHSDEAKKRSTRLQDIIYDMEPKLEQNKLSKDRNQKYIQILGHFSKRHSSDVNLQTTLCSSMSSLIGA